MSLKAGETFIVGMDGGLESTVAAYLLKKQGHNCIGVCVVYHEDDSEFNDILGACLPDDLDNIKSICKALEIPFYATNASEMYFQDVIEGIIASRLSGMKYEPMVDRACVILRTLVDKMASLGASYVATGHFCKILKNQTSGMLNLYNGNDPQEDDSYYISKLGYELLDKVHFPLAELREQEVLKVGSLIPVNFKLNKKRRRFSRLSLMEHEQLYKLVEKYSATSLRKDGVVLNHYDSSTVGDHLGIHQFYLGQSNFPLKTKTQGDKDLEVLRIVPSQGLVLVEKSHKIKFSHVYLHRFVTDKNLNRSLPVSAYAMLSPRAEVQKCAINFKNNNTLVLEFKEEIQGHCPAGSYVVLYNKSGIGARVIGGGIVKRSGYYDDGEWRGLPKTKDQEDEHIEEKQKKKELGF